MKEDFDEYASPNGITTYGNYLWILDSNTEQVYNHYFSHAPENLYLEMEQVQHLKIALILP